MSKKQIVIRLIIMSALLYGAYNYLFQTVPNDRGSYYVTSQDGTFIFIPAKALLPGSIELEQVDPYTQKSEKVHKTTYDFLQSISTIWQEHNTASQYLVFGKDHNQRDFRWEIVPYKDASGALSRIWQQFKVLWGISFGASQNTVLEYKKVSFYQNEIEGTMKKIDEIAPEVDPIVQGTDPFCQQDVIEKQRVLEGKHINVLYNYAPIGFGGERLHFLFVPKQHRKDFKDLSKEEYTEASLLAAKITEVFRRENGERIAYLFHKTGKDAGQTVEHWHLHLVITSNPTQDFIGKLTVLWNMIFQSSPLNDEELSKQVEQYRKKLA